VYTIKIPEQKMKKFATSKREIKANQKRHRSPKNAIDEQLSSGKSSRSPYYTDEQRNSVGCRK
jgi:hypothetical protein